MILSQGKQENELSLPEQTCARIALAAQDIELGQDHQDGRDSFEIACQERRDERMERLLL